MKSIINTAVLLSMGSCMKYCQAFSPLIPNPGTSSVGSPLVSGKGSAFRSCHAAIPIEASAIDAGLIDAGIDFGIAVVSAAAGAASQIPKIHELQRELETTRAALTQSEQDLVLKITELENKLFEMDKEYEAQTTKFKKQYDNRMRDELQRTTEKLKVDYQYKLEIRLAEQKSQMLSKKLDLVNTVTGNNNREELLQLRVQQEKIDKANSELEDALEASNRELERLRNEASAKKRGWWPF